MSTELDQMIASRLRAQSEAIADAGFSRKVSERVMQIQRRRMIARLIPALFAAVGTALVMLLQVRWSGVLEALNQLLGGLQAVNLPMAAAVPLWVWASLAAVLLAGANSALRSSES